MANIYPIKNSEKILWLRNFKHHFAIIAENFGFSVDDVSDVEKACDTAVFAIRMAENAKKYSKVCVAFRNAFTNTKKKMTMTIPEFIQIEPPPELFTANALAFIQEIANLLKAQRNFTSSTGELLGIMPVKSALSLADAKPPVKLQASPNSVVLIKWKKGKAQAVLVESKRGDKENFTELGRYFQSPVRDERPPLEHGKPELRFYRLQYLQRDKIIGVSSEIYTITTNP